MSPSSAGQEGKTNALPPFVPKKCKLRACERERETEAQRERRLGSLSRASLPAGIRELCGDGARKRWSGAPQRGSHLALV